MVFIHGVATTAAIWRDVTPYFGDFDIVCPERPASGDLDVEIDALAAVCREAVVVGVSGGATLGVELASRRVPIAGGVFHEPAAGSLAPGLLDHVAAGLRDNGVEGFGRALYGPAWSPGDAPADDGAVAREFAMFREYEPSPIADDAVPVLLTTGSASPPARQASVRALSTRLDRPWTSVLGGSHAVHLECPEAFSAVIIDHIRRSCG